jgi:hypothetical protein
MANDQVRAMLTTAQIRDVLADLTYKPGWTFSVYDGDWEGQHLAITARVPDAVRPPAMVVLDVHSQLPPIPDEAYLVRWIAWRLGRIELHEMREFLRLRGAVVYDPHAANAERDNPNYKPEEEDLGG